MLLHGESHAPCNSIRRFEALRTAKKQEVRKSTKSGQNFILGKPTVSCCYLMEEHTAAERDAEVAAEQEQEEHTSAERDAEVAA